MANHIICDVCLKKRGPTEEKSCTHGLRPDIICDGCGRQRADNDPGWACLGHMSDAKKKMLEELRLFEYKFVNAQLVSRVLDSRATAAEVVIFTERMRKLLEQ